MESSTIWHEAREPVDFASLYGLDNPERIDTWELWKQRSSGTAKVPIGVTPTGTLAELTIPAVAKINSGRGFGHGLVAGAADTGRAELLRAIVLGLALRNSPAAVNFFFVDFHGRGTFDGLADLPHTAGLVSGVAHDLGLADRTLDRLTSEYKRRLELFEVTGNFGDLEHYERARTAGLDLAPMPTLVVVIDGIAELVAQQPEFRMLLVTYGRIGRVIGAHLVLAAQQPAETVTPELPSYLAYHITLGPLPADTPQSVPAGARIHPDTPDRCYLHTGPESVPFEPVRLSPVSRPGGNTEYPCSKYLLPRCIGTGGRRFASDRRRPSGTSSRPVRSVVHSGSAVQRDPCRGMFTNPESGVGPRYRAQGGYLTVPGRPCAPHHPGRTRPHR